VPTQAAKTRAGKPDTTGVERMHHHDRSGLDTHRAVAGVRLIRLRRFKDRRGYRFK